MRPIVRLLLASLALAPLAAGCGQTPSHTSPTAVAGDADGDGVTRVDGDCDDANASVHPGAQEACNDVDDDCNGAIDDGEDQDGDLYGTCTGGASPMDCDDADATINPGAAEVAYDGIDQDCDDRDLTDVDADGWDAAEAGGQDCDDTLEGVYPGAVDTPYDALDQDCDGQDTTDADGDGWDGAAAGGMDCDDAQPEVHPEAEEVLDGIDNDCDGAVDRVDIGQAPRAWIGEYAGDGAGTSVAALGDVDGDGLLDRAVGAPGADGSAEGSGKVYLLLGASQPASGDLDLSYADVTFVGVAPFEAAGARVAGVGDLNADGLDDLAVVAPGPAEAEDVGRVYLVFGRAAGWPARVSLGEADGVLTGLTLGDTLGAAPIHAGDFDGDGLDDLALGLPGFDDPGLTGGRRREDTGALAVFRGGVERIWLGDVLDADQLWLGSADGERAGAALARMGDLTGDGRDELAIGAPSMMDVDGITTPGGVYLLFGRAEARDVAPSLAGAEVTLRGAKDLDQVGTALAAGEDLSGDGFPDLAVGAPGASSGAGAVYLLFGKPSGLALSLTPTDADATWTTTGSGTAAGAALAMSPPIEEGAPGALWVGMPGARGPVGASGQATQGAVVYLDGPDARLGGSLDAATAILWGQAKEGAGMVLAPGTLGGLGEGGAVLAGLPLDTRGGEGAGAAVVLRGP